MFRIENFGDFGVQKAAILTFGSICQRPNPYTTPRVCPIFIEKCLMMDSSQIWCCNSWLLWSNSELADFAVFNWRSKDS